MKAISKGSLAGCLVHLVAGSTPRLALQNLQIPEHADNRTLPSWLFDARLSARDKLTSSRLGTILVTPLPTKKHKSPITPHLHHWHCGTGRCLARDNTAEMHMEFNVNKSLPEGDTPR